MRLLSAPSALEAALRQNFLSLDATRIGHVGHNPILNANDPSLCTNEFAFLSRSGQTDSEVNLF